MTKLYLKCIYNNMCSNLVQIYQCLFSFSRYNYLLINFTKFYGGIVKTNVEIHVTHAQVGGGGRTLNG